MSGKFEHMSATEIVEQFRKLPRQEQRLVLEQLSEESEDELTPEEIAELDRRAEYALAHPENCRPLEEVVADIERRFRGKR
jgi:hypothetical protein